MPTFLLLLAVAALVWVQSIFGVGLLIFGTPLLLLCGYPFDLILSVLLPVSLMVSLSQILAGGIRTCGDNRSFFLLLSAGLLIGLAVSIRMHFAYLDLLVCLTLVVAAYLRLSASRRHLLVYAAKRFRRGALLFIGALHGVSNMGGSLLEAYASSLWATKVEIRHQIALGYALMAATQLVVLCLLQRFVLSFATAACLAVGAAVYATIGRVSFERISSDQYSSLVPLVMLIAACALVAKRIMHWA